MAPPIPVYKSVEECFEASRRRDKSLRKFANYQALDKECPLRKQLVQFNCEIVQSEIRCIPFKRLFHSCLINGKERLIEIPLNHTL